MNYFSFLSIFVVIPIAVLLVVLCWNRATSPLLWIGIGVQVALAVCYTTPWDNYLVATGVWHYNAKQVSGLILGYVPIEEYTFFVLEALLGGLWWQLCFTGLRASAAPHPSAAARTWSAIGTVLMWGMATVLLFSGWKAGTYLSITLAWALPPLILQLAFGADILWHERKLIGATVVPLGIYLAAADALAIRAGIWTIDPAQSTVVFIGQLPIEEAVFFVVTVILIAFGLTLTLSEESQKRLLSVRRSRRQMVNR